MKLLCNTRHCFNFYKTSNSTSPMLYWRLTNSETISRDHVQLAVNINFFILSFFTDSSKKIVWYSDLLIHRICYQGRRSPLHSRRHQEAIKKKVCLSLYDSSINQALQDLVKYLDKSNLGYICLTKTTRAILWYPFLNLVFENRQEASLFNILWYKFPYFCSKICNGLCSKMCCMHNRSTLMSATP